MKKLNEISITSDTMKAIGDMQVERMNNLALLQQRGKVPVASLMLGELVMIECKLDALLLMMENGGKDFTEFNEFLFQAAKQGKSAAIMVREQFTAAKGGGDGTP